MNEKRFVFGLSTTSSYSFCNSFGKNITHLFCDCTIRRYIQKKLRLNLKNDLTLFPITPQAAIFDFLELDCQSYLIPNHILLILKLYVYKSRKKKILSSTCLLQEISKIKNIVKKFAFLNEKKTLHIKVSGENLKTKYLKEVTTLLFKYKQNFKIRHDKSKRNILVI